MGQPTIFLDKDGTLIKDVPYNVDTNRIVLEDGADQGLRQLAEACFRFVVVSNQSGVARGYFHEDALDKVYLRINELVEQAAGIALDGFYYCPHHPQGSVAYYALQCSCRKPQAGMLFNAAEDLGINLKEAWMIGDILDDVEAGQRAGCRTILIDNGHETEWRTGPLRDPHYYAADLSEAAEIILRQTGIRGETRHLRMGKTTR